MINENGLSEISDQSELNPVINCYLAVFHVTDINGNKLKDENVISYIEQVKFSKESEN